MISSIIENIEKYQWRFAKTMPDEPHWYTIRKDWENDQDFVDFVLFIRKYGYRVKYKNSYYTKFNINGYMYWSMGAPINYKNGSPCTILINRAKIDYKTPYDDISDKYDGLFNDYVSHKEDQSLFSMLNIKGDVLDIGCGTGLYFEYCNHYVDIKGDYLGIDISQGMLDVFAKKYPGTKLINTTVQDFYSNKKYDTVLGLYGVGSYLTEQEIKKCFQFLKPGGLMYIMCFSPGYYPVTYKETGIECQHVLHEKNGFNVVKFHNFLIYTNDKTIN